MLESVLQNLINIGWAMLIFLAAYLANVAFSLWYNIKIRPLTRTSSLRAVSRF